MLKFYLFSCLIGTKMLSNAGTVHPPMYIWFLPHRTLVEQSTGKLSTLNFSLRTNTRPVASFPNDAMLIKMVVLVNYANQVSSLASSPSRYRSIPQYSGAKRIHKIEC